MDAKLVATFAGLFSLCFVPNALAVQKVWGNSGTNYNAGASWGGTAPGTGDVGAFTTAVAFQPNLTASLSNAGIYFNAVSGYDLTSSNSSITLTLTATATTPGGTEASNSTAAAIAATNNSGTNTVDASLVLAPSTGTSTFYQENGGTLIVNGNISGSGITLNINGTSGGIIQLAGNNSYSGGTTLQSGMTLNINSATAIGSGTLTVNASATIDNTSANAITLTNNNAINLSAPILTFIGTKDLSFGSGIVTMNGGDRTITVTNAGATLTVGGIAQDASSRKLTKNGDGSLVITGASSYTGTTTVSAGVLNIRNSIGLGTGAVTVSSGAALQLQGGITVANAFNNAGAGFGLNGTGLSNDGALRNISGDNTISALLHFGGTTTRINSDSGTLNITNTGTINGGNDNVDLIFGGAGNISVATRISTAGHTLTKDGSGTLTLTNTNNNYSGGTTINAGTLLVNNASGTGVGTGAVQVNNSGTLGGTGFGGAGGVTVATGGIVEGGNGTTGTTLTLSGALTLQSNSIIELTLGASGAHSTLARTGTGSWSFDTAQKFTFIDAGAAPGFYDNIITGLASAPNTSPSTWTITNSGWSGTFAYDNAGHIDLTLTNVPEPSTWIAAALTLAALAWSQRKRLRGEHRRPAGRGASRLSLAALSSTARECSQKLFEL